MKANTSLSQHKNKNLNEFSAYDIDKKITKNNNYEINSTKKIVKESVDSQERMKLRTSLSQMKFAGRNSNNQSTVS